MAGLFINCRKAIEIKAGTEICKLPKGYIGAVPEWVKEHWYFQALCKDGTITAIVSTKDSDLEESDKKARNKAKASSEKANKKAVVDNEQAKISEEQAEATVANQ